MDENEWSDVFGFIADRHAFHSLPVSAPVSRVLPAVIKPPAEAGLPAPLVVSPVPVIRGISPSRYEGAFSEFGCLSEL